jgi:hypothetical protein
MTRSAILSTVLLLGTRAFAAYDKFHYTTKASNWLCPGMSWQCITPSICAHDGLTNLYNCCDSDADDAVCWNNSTPCEGKEDNTPASNQIGCSSGANAFCCLKGRWVSMEHQCESPVLNGSPGKNARNDSVSPHESGLNSMHWIQGIDRSLDQINVCWEIAADPFRNVSQAKMNATFSSLSSASPSANTLVVVDIAVLTATSKLAASTITSVSTRKPQSSPTATHVSTSTFLADTVKTATAEPVSKSGVSGGTIGGAVIGAIAGIALGGGAFFLFRRWRRSSPTPKCSELEGHGPANPYLGNQMYQQSVPQEKYAGEVAVQAHSSYPLQELSANSQPVEMDGSSIPPPKVPHSFA